MYIPTVIITAAKGSSRFGIPRHNALPGSQVYALCAGALRA